MVIEHKGVRYWFDYAFAPITGDGIPVETAIDGKYLDGEIAVHSITGPHGHMFPAEVLTEIYPLMWEAAAREELEQRRLWELKAERQAAESLRARISLVPRRDKAFN